MKKKILLGHENLTNDSERDLEFILGCIHKWQEIRLSSKSTYFIRYSTHDCSRTYLLIGIFWVTWDLILMVDQEQENPCLGITLFISNATLSQSQLRVRINSLHSLRLWSSGRETVKSFSITKQRIRNWFQNFGRLIMLFVDISSFLN